MPHPYGSNRLSPEDLARELAGKLASSRPEKTRFSFRDSVLVGRLISALIILGTGAAVLGAVLFGVDWWAGRSAAEVLSSAPIASDEHVATTILPAADISGGRDIPFGAGLMSADLAWIAATSPVPPPLPSPSPTRSGVISDTPSTTGVQEPSGSTPMTTTTSGLAPSSSPSTSTTLGDTTTTEASTTTTMAGTTTTTGATTTTPPETPTTCVGNNGGGQGRGPCGP